MRWRILMTLFAGLAATLVPGCAATDDPAGAARKAAHQTGRAITWPFRKVAQHYKEKKEAGEVPMTTASAGATEEKPIVASRSKTSEAAEKDGSARLASARSNEVRIESNLKGRPGSDSESDSDSDEPAPSKAKRRAPIVEASDVDEEEEPAPKRRKSSRPTVDDASSDRDSDPESDPDDRPARNPSWKSKSGRATRSASSSDPDTIRIE